LLRRGYLETVRTLVIGHYIQRCTCLGGGDPGQSRLVRLLLKRGYESHVHNAIKGNNYSTEGFLVRSGYRLGRNIDFS